MAPSERLKMNSRYEEQAQALVLNLTTTIPDVTFDRLVRMSQGLYPADVLRAARSAHVDIAMTKPDDCATDTKPHPSPATSEWFFTDETASTLAEHLPGRALCLGTPSVASIKARAGDPVTLIDVSPWARERFGLSEPHADVRLGTRVESVELDAQYDSAILDPPWYFPALTNWLRLASSAVKTGGTILIPLLGALTRPSAEADRALITATASKIGKWTVRPNCVAYETPRFERLALERSGVVLTSPWRYSDLLIISNANRANAPERTPSLNEEWIDFRIGNSIIAVRGGQHGSTNTDAGDLTLSGFGPEESFQLDTVSRRDQRVKRANVWTSENTAAVCSDAAALKQLLSRDPRSLNRIDRDVFERVVSQLELSN